MRMMLNAVADEDAAKLVRVFLACTSWSRVMSWWQFPDATMIGSAPKRLRITRAHQRAVAPGSRSSRQQPQACSSVRKARSDFIFSFAGCITGRVWSQARIWSMMQPAGALLLPEDCIDGYLT
jgi:hypothetical protein